MTGQDRVAGSHWGHFTAPLVAVSSEFTLSGRNVQNGGNAEMD